MSKPLAPTQKNGASRPIPDDAAPGVVQALPEDGVATAPGDEAATGGPAPESQLQGVPYLGETRRRALAQAGIRTLDDLRAASVERIGGVKGVGMVNAARVKEWLAVQAEMPAVAQATPIPETGDSASALAAANQDVQDVFQKLGTAAARLKDVIPARARDKALDRQLDKLDTVASELAEGPDTLSAKQVQEAVKTLDKIAALLEKAAGAEKLSPKKQSDLIEELRGRRKRLQKTLGD